LRQSLAVEALQIEQPDRARHLPLAGDQQRERAGLRLLHGAVQVGCLLTES